MTAYAELAINIEAPLEGTFHYFVPADLQAQLVVGHLVEVEFGRRLAQGIILAFDDAAPVDEVKPVISLIDSTPVVQPWQIALAGWLSEQYLTPLNACLRLMLPPGLTRWSDITLDIDPRWDGQGRLTEAQERLIALLREQGDLRGRQIGRALPKKLNWKSAAEQLVRRGILRKATILDPPRIRPKEIRTAELIAGPGRTRRGLLQMGRASKEADLLACLLLSDDPLPAETAVLTASGASPKHLTQLVEAGLVERHPGRTIVAAAGRPAAAPPRYRDLLRRLPLTESEWQAVIGELDDETAVPPNELLDRIDQPETLSLAVSQQQALDEALARRGATTYQAIVRLLAHEAQPVEVGATYAAAGASIYHLRQLVKADLIRLGSEEVWRDPLADRDFVPAEAPILTADQAHVWQQIRAVMGDAEAGVVAGAGPPRPDHSLWSPAAPPATPPFLLHGVTGSGKTEIYMRAIDYALRRGQTAIVLVPEIALTPQTVRRFAARFPGRVAVLHSRLSDGERYDTWRRARQGLFDIVVGPRSALFTPLENLGVIVVDEEHDHSYKQTPPVPPPYYHARDTAIALGQITGATVIMGSATPDLVTYHRGQSGRYRLLDLPKRIMGHRQRISGQAERLGVASRYNPAGDEEADDAWTIPLPPIQVVDLRQELRAGNRSIFSRALQEALDNTLARREQAILFLNRRGTASFVMCRDCGLVLSCPRCDLPLTYHRPHLALVCHHCGHQEPPAETCPRCGSRRIKHFGLGTEQVEALVQQRWPHARTVRWDRDTTAGRDTHEELLASFINHEADILIGTQMIAKGLDLPLVTLVGVISADVSLGLPDYRTGERTFQNLTQVAGRAGRGLLGGRVILQTYQPEHYAIQAAAEHDYTGFYLAEIRFRTQHSLPPFRRLAQLIMADAKNEHARRQAEQLAKALRLHIREKALGATDLLGPVPPFFNRIDGRYRWQILVRSPDPVRLLHDFHVPRPWIVNIDPVSTL